MFYLAKKLYYCVSCKIYSLGILYYRHRNKRLAEYNRELKEKLNGKD